MKSSEHPGDHHRHQGQPVPRRRSPKLGKFFVVAVLVHVIVVVALFLYFGTKSEEEGRVIALDVATQPPASSPLSTHQPTQAGPERAESDRQLRSAQVFATPNRIATLLVNAYDEPSDVILYSYPRG